LATGVFEEKQHGICHRKAQQDNDYHTHERCKPVIVALKHIDE